MPHEAVSCQDVRFRRVEEHGHERRDGFGRQFEVPPVAPTILRQRRKMVEQVGMEQESR